MDSIVVEGQKGVLNVTLNKPYENCSIALQKYSLTNYSFYNHADTEKFFISIPGTARKEYTLTFPANITQNSLCVAVNTLPHVAGDPFLTMSYSGTEYTLLVTGLCIQSAAYVDVTIGDIFNRYLNGIGLQYFIVIGGVRYHSFRLTPYLYGFAKDASSATIVAPNLASVVGWSSTFIVSLASRTMMIFRAQNTSQNFLNEPVIGVKVNAPLEVYNSQYIDIIMPKTNSITVSEENENLYWVPCNYLPINLTFTLVYLSRDLVTNSIQEIPFRNQTFSTLTLLISTQSVSNDKP